MYKIIALMGKAGSGKDTMMKKVLEKTTSLNEIISCTTRPRRESEVEGVNYFYLTPEQFGDKVLHDEMLEATCFNDWFYGTSYDALRSDVVNIGVFNPTGIESLLGRPDVEVEVYYIAASAKTRLLRQLNREEDPDVNEIVRRYKTDESDFMELDFDYKMITNETPECLEAGVEVILASVESSGSARSI